VLITFSSRNANTSVQCPVKPGDKIVEQTVALPKEIPKGEIYCSSKLTFRRDISTAKFTVNVNAYTKDDDELVCLKLTIDFMKKPFFKW
jgi:hypothetical protein